MLHTSPMRYTMVSELRPPIVMSTGLTTETKSTHMPTALSKTGSQRLVSGWNTRLRLFFTSARILSTSSLNRLVLLSATSSPKPSAAVSTRTRPRLVATLVCASAKSGDARPSLGVDVSLPLSGMAPAVATQAGGPRLQVAGQVWCLRFGGAGPQRVQK